MKKLCPIIIGFILTAGCAKEEGFQIDEIRPAAINTISAVGSYPKDLDQGIPLDAGVRIRFTGPIRTQSVDHVSFRVTDDLGQNLNGEFSFNSTYDEVTWFRKVNGQNLSLDPETTYRVRVNYLQDNSSNLVPPYIFEFRTKDYSNPTGKFHVVYAGRHNPTGSNPPAEDSKSMRLGPTDRIYIQFSEGFNSNSPTCDRSKFANALQVIDAALITQNGNGQVNGLTGNTCVLCRNTPNGRVCDTLQFIPDNQLPLLGGVQVEVRPSEALRGTSGETLKEKETYRFYVMFNLTF